MDYMEFRYKNYRGEYGIRTVLPKKIYWGSNEYHEEPQWLMFAWDKDKMDNRVFAMKDIQEFL